MRLRSILAVVLALLPATAAIADEVEDFYKGKTVKLLIGGNAGVSYDLAGRAIARHITRHIPGNPTMIVENMPGASSLIMMNHFYNRVPRDGTVIGAPLNNILLEPKLKLLSGQGGNVQFELGKMNWLGSPVQEPQVLWVWHTTGVKTLAELGGRPVTMGATSPGADNHTLPLLSNKLLGTNMTVVVGYKSPADVFIAAERGEVNGISTALSTLMSTRRDWIKSGQARLLIQFGGTRVADLPDVPTAIELSPTPQAKAVFEFIASKFVLARPYALPPDTPPARVKALRAAFDATMKDRAFLDDAAKTSLDIDAVGGARMEQIIAMIEGTSAEVVDLIRDIMTKK